MDKKQVLAHSWEWLLVTNPPNPHSSARLTRQLSKIPLLAHSSFVENLFWATVLENQTELWERMALSSWNSYQE
jgi:hypothetical protein